MIAVRRALIFRHRFLPCSYKLSAWYVFVLRQKSVCDRKVEVGVCKELIIRFLFIICHEQKLTLGLGVYKTGIRPSITLWKTSLS